MSVSGRSTAPKPPSADDEGFKRELVQLIPHLRAFARTLTGDPTAADDLAQDAMMKAWDARASYQMGTNMKAWTFMILRNQFYSEKRRSWRSSQLDQEAAERRWTRAQVVEPGEGGEQRAGTGQASSCTKYAAAGQVGGNRHGITPEVGGRRLILMTAVCPRKN